MTTSPKTLREEIDTTVRQYLLTTDQAYAVSIPSFINRLDSLITSEVEKAVDGYGTMQAGIKDTMVREHEKALKKVRRETAQRFKEAMAVADFPNQNLQDQMMQQGYNQAIREVHALVDQILEENKE